MQILERETCDLSWPEWSRRLNGDGSLSAKRMEIDSPLRENVMMVSTLKLSSE